MRYITLIGLLILIPTILSIISLAKSFEGEWVCITKTCVDWIEGDEWIAKNCRPEGDNPQLVCNLTIDGKDYKAPLGIINISNVKDCGQYQCVNEVYVRRNSYVPIS